MASIEEKIIEIKNQRWKSWDNILDHILDESKHKNSHLLKINLVKSSKYKLIFQTVFIKDLPPFLKDSFVSKNTSKYKTNRNINCLVVPTGIGASIGGYAGDANPLCKLFSKDCDYLLTHPNVINGAVLSDPVHNSLILEGYFLDQFLLNNISLKLSNPKIGIIFDSGINKQRLDYEINVINALRAFLGVNIVGYTITKKNINIKTTINNLGFSTGNIKNIDYLCEAADRLIKQGVNKIAVCCKIKDSSLNKKYISGYGIDPIGGIESRISHILSYYTGHVCAHAPVLDSVENADYKNIAPVSASEYIADTFLPSVISGLRFTPDIVKQTTTEKSNIYASEIKKIITPHSGFGSSGIIHHLLNKDLRRKVILVKENQTCLDVNPLHISPSINRINKYIDLANKKDLMNIAIDLNILKRPLQKVKYFN